MLSGRARRSVRRPVLTTGPAPRPFPPRPFPARGPRPGALRRPATRRRAVLANQLDSAVQLRTQRARPRAGAPGPCQQHRRRRPARGQRTAPRAGADAHSTVAGLLAIRWHPSFWRSRWTATAYAASDCPSGLSRDSTAAEAGQPARARSSPRPPLGREVRPARPAPCVPVEARGRMSADRRPAGGRSACGAQARVPRNPASGAASRWRHWRVRQSRLCVARRVACATVDLPIDSHLFGCSPAG